MTEMTSKKQVQPTKEEFEDQVLDLVVNYKSQHRDLSVDMWVARKIVYEIIHGCPDDSSIIDYAIELLPELMNKAEKSEEMFRTFKYDFSHNIFLNYWQYYKYMKQRLTPINEMALRLGLDATIYTNGVEYDIRHYTHGLHLKDYEGKLPLKHHISPFARLFHNSELKQTMSAIDAFQKEFAEYITKSQPAVLAEAEKYKDSTTYNVVAKFDCHFRFSGIYTVLETEVTPRVFLELNTMKSAYPLFFHTAGTRRAVYEAVKMSVS